MRPEAKAALVALMDDPHEDVRAMSPRGLVFLLRQGKADDAVPRLVQMLADPSEKVRARAAEELGEVRDATVVPPLLRLLEDERLARQSQPLTSMPICFWYAKTSPVWCCRWRMA